MSEAALSDAIARRSITGSPRSATASQATPAEKVVGFLTGYIPTATVALFIPLWAAIQLALTTDPPRIELDTTLRFLIAAVAAVIAGLWVWGIGYQKAVKAATDAAKPKPTRLDVLKASIPEVASAVFAMFVWATMMPESWLLLTDPSQPLLLGTFAVAVLAVVNMFTGRQEPSNLR
ncbi:MAG TPA: hypothetical protein VEX62_08440 [Candidatus Limnocylindrales bacterium]|nr:hypothetical protein [Candidatus Limnocylindrales bacterium]